MKVYKIPVWLVLKKNEDGSVYPGRVIGFPPGSVSSDEAVIHFAVEVTDSIFDPALDTGITIKVGHRTDDFDVTKVVSGLKAIRDEIEAKEKPF